MLTTNLTLCKICALQGHCALEEKYKKVIDTLFDIDSDMSFRNTVQCDMYVRPFEHPDLANFIDNDPFSNRQRAMGIIPSHFQMNGVEFMGCGCPCQFGYLDNGKK